MAMYAYIIDIQKVWKSVKEIGSAPPLFLAPTCAKQAFVPTPPQLRNILLGLTGAWIDGGLLQLLQDPLCHDALLPNHVDKVDRNAAQAFDQHHVNGGFFVVLSRIELHMADVLFLVFTRGPNLQMAPCNLLLVKESPEGVYVAEDREHIGGTLILLVLIVFFPLPG